MSDIDPSMSACPASREAVTEQEERGEVGCPICGRDAFWHSPEPLIYAKADERWLREFVRAAAATLHDLNWHVRSPQNAPKNNDWTTGCEHPDCRNARTLRAVAPADLDYAALARDGTVDPDRYHSDAIYHAIVWRIYDGPPPPEAVDGPKQE